MQDLDSIKLKIGGMSKITLAMWQGTFRAFMDHDLNLLSKVLEEEDKLNILEKELAEGLVQLGRSFKEKDLKAQVTVYVDVIGDLELIGDYCKDILERVQIKIEEKLLFSEDAVKEYTELYNKTEEALKEVVAALDKDNPGLLKEVLKGQEHIDSLVDQYRKHHNQRLINGICSPMACNMFLNMLDFTAAVYYHTKKIAKDILNLR